MVSLEYSYKDNEENLSLSILTEDEQGVNGNSPGYMKALEVSVNKSFSLGQEKLDEFNNTRQKLNLSDDEMDLYNLNNPSPILLVGRVVMWATTRDTSCNVMKSRRCIPVDRNVMLREVTAWRHRSFVNSIQAFTAW